jgi:hypothetical protein
LIKAAEKRKDGRELTAILREHFDDPHAELTRRTTAHNTLENLRYVSEGSLKFMDFISKLQGAYSTLERYGHYVSDEQRSFSLMKKMSGCTEPAVRVCVQNAYQKSRYRMNWQKLVSLVGENVQMNDRHANMSSRDKRKLAAAAKREKGQGQGETENGKSKKGKKKRKGKYANYVPKEKWDRLTDEEKSKLRGKPFGKMKCSVGAVQSDGNDDASTDEPASNGVPTTHAGNAFGSGGKRARLSSVSSSVHYATPATRNVAVTKSVKQQHERGQAELDSHADTHTLGAGCVILTETGRSCSVYPFSDKMGSAADVKIVTWDSPSGETYILVFNEALWFGSDLDVTLINPNQCRYYGMQICDDPTDLNRDLSIVNPISEVTIDMEMRGTLVGFDIRTPTDRELRECTQIVMSSQQPWEPKEVSFSPEELARIRVSSAISKDRHSAHTPEELAKKWRVSLNVCSEKPCKPRHSWQFVRLYILCGVDTGLTSQCWDRLKTRMYSDTMFSRVKSISGNTCAQVFCNHSYVKVIPMSSKANAGDALQTFVQDVGIPVELVVDSAAEQVGPNSVFSKNVHRYDIKVHRTEPYTPRQNHAEQTIGELRRRWRSLMAPNNVTSRLWDYALVYEAEILSRIVRGDNEVTGVERLTGDTVDISEWLDFKFYDLVWYWYATGEDHNPRIGRWLGVVHRIGSHLCYYALAENGFVEATTTVQHIPEFEQRKPVVAAQIDAYPKSLNE